MSRPRFAPITADLLARKGEAKPWREAGRQMPGWEDSATRIAPGAPEPAPAPPPAHAAEWKKCAVRMTHHDYERLGLLAVKRGTSRQHLLQQAVDALLSGLPYQSGGGCACIANAGSPKANGPTNSDSERSRS